MREILFRGKEVESGDWYYGDAIGLGICVAGIAYLILKGGSDDD